MLMRWTRNSTLLKGWQQNWLKINMTGNILHDSPLTRVKIQLTEEQTERFRRERSLSRKPINLTIQRRQRAKVIRVKERMRVHNQIVMRKILAAAIHRRRQIHSLLMRQRNDRLQSGRGRA